MTSFYKISCHKSIFSNLFCIISIFLFSGINSSKAQLTFNNGSTAQQLAELLAGPSITVSNATINCAASGIASFSGSSSIGFTNGVLLTSGSTAIVSPSASSSSAGNCNSTPGDTQLNTLIGATTYDACALEFDIIPICDTLRFNFVFGSEEYPEFVNANVNDPFAFFISGPGITGQPNIAVLPNGTDVSIDNVNSTTNSQYYITNSGTSIEYDGYTTVLAAWVVVQPCQTYHLKIVIADAGDCIYDSGVFLEAGSIQCQPVSATATIPTASEGCQDGAFEFCRPGSTSAAATISYTIAGTAINGTDYNTIATSITIPAGQACVSLPIIPIVDGTVEPTESVFLIYQPGGCSAIDTVKIFISGVPTLDAGPDTALCSGGTASIGIPPVPGTTYSWTPTTGLSNASLSNPTVTLTNSGSASLTTNYLLTATSSGCVATDTVAVRVDPVAVANAGPDKTICGGNTTLLGTIAGSATSGTWSGGSGTFNPNNTTLNCIYTPSVAEIDSGSVTLTLTTNDPVGPCSSASDQMVIMVSPQDIVSAGPDQTICISSSVTLQGFVGGSADSATWSGGAGTYNPDNTNPTAIYTPSAAEEAAGSVTLTFTPNDTTASCVGVSDQVTITINHLPTANAGSGQYVCSGSNITLAGSVGGSATGGTWSGGSGTYAPDNTTLNAVYSPSIDEYAAGSVQLTLTTNDPAGPCTFSTSNVTFNFYESPVVNFIADTSAGCPVHCTDFSNSTTLGGGGSIVSWNWDFGDGGAGSTLENPSNCFSETGFYDIKLIATSSNGCVSSLIQTHLVEVYSLPVAEFDYTPKPASVLDPSILFNNQSSSDVNYWNWNFGDGDSLVPGTANPDHEYPVAISGSYFVTLIVHNVNGCYDTVVHEISIKPAFTFFVPNAFSPNDGTGTNDYFFGSGTGIIKYDLLIFDRWGDMVFHGKELNEKWDGKANEGSSIAQMDVFVWKVQLTDVFNKVHNYIGTVTIVK